MDEIETIRRTLREMLESGSEGIVVVNHKRVNQFIDRGCQAVVFDFDGVLIKEIGIVEKGYAWLLRAVRDEILDPENIVVDDKDVKLARDFRPNIKGKSILEKVDAFRSEFGKSSTALDINNLIRRWLDAFKFNVIAWFADNPENYRMEGAHELLQTASSKSLVFGVTANEYLHANWLMEFVGFKKYFVEVVGYPTNAFPNTSKGSLLADLLFRREIYSQNACYIGDGTSDIKAGIKAGTLNIGISNATMPVSMINDDIQRKKVINSSLVNGEKLAVAGCDILATSPMAHQDLAKFF